MRALVAVMRTEFRDRRLVLVGMALAVPILALSAAWLHGSRLSSAFASGLAAYGALLGLLPFVIVVSGDLFAGERQRATLDFTRRLPAGLRVVLWARVTAYVVGATVAAAWGWFCAVLALGLFAPGGFSIDSLAAVARGPSVDALVWAALVMVVGCWSMLMGAWIPQAGAALLAALMALAALALPFYLVVRRLPWLPEHMLGPVDAWLPVAFVLAALPILVLALSYVRANRLMRSAWSAAWRGLVLLGVLGAAGGAWAATIVREACEVDPARSDFRIVDGVVGPGERYAYINVGMQPHPDSASRRPLATQPWIVDLEDGQWQPVGSFGDAFQPIVQGPARAQPCVVLDGQQGEWRWYEGAVAEQRFVRPSGAIGPDLFAWWRSQQAAHARHHDASGRAFWVELGRIVREGDPLPARLSADGLARVRPGVEIDGGWMAWRPDARHGVTIEAASGIERDPWSPHMDIAHGPVVLSTRWALVRNRAGGSEAPWHLVDLDGEVPERVLKFDPSPGIMPIPLGGGRLLLPPRITSTETPLRFYDLATDATREVRDGQGEVVSCALVDVLGRLADGRVVLATSTAPDSRLWVRRHIVLDLERALATKLPVKGRFMRPLAFAADNSIVAIEEDLRIVRYHTDAGRREVLFPRPGP